ncbi:glucose/arabinose dehydrogenase/PKD repeat protein [Agromyces sp. 3263]|uniref:PQQ-dependent sugar dehydrogenase n=1 Tax=Agromyces sp. 3263 TaxID=2817750 RepID=UPI00285FBE35|nr:PQQ-dependent sugar dehydrogenase [Agromyces sp. 3263]MDR6905665.1 glucose/arabinose dehydrogenase/PKD repeat protein [Agromyces sp. 3263]
MSKSRIRLGALVLSGLLAVTSLSLSAGAASAHDGEDHGDEVAATTWANYEKVTLTKDVGEPIDMAVLPDSRVLHTTRGGQVRLTDPAQGTTTVVNTIDVYANSEDGLQTITLDPDFEENGWVYLYYAPRTMTAPYPATTPTGSAPNSLPAGADASYWDQWKGYNQLSRFKWNFETSSLDLSTEQAIIKVEVQRGQCCHVAGDVAFDKDGNVLLATGDNTPASAPGASGYAPMNDRAGFNPGFDSRRGAGNSNDLRGKILRIDVHDDGSYTIPAGNLFAPGTTGARPEIFVMGVRNPFRIDYDPVTSALTWGDYGPDAGTANDQRGPMGYVEWQSTTVPLNGGWPYCHGPNANYSNWDYETLTVRGWYDCAGTLVNPSPYNTGLQQLPSATAPQIWYGDQPTHQPWTEFGSGGQAPMGGPTYRYDEENTSATKFPSYWSGKPIMAEFSRDRIFVFDQEDPDGEVTKIQEFLPNSALTAAGMPVWDNVMDLEFGPDGSLYVLDYGDGFFRPNPDAGLYRVDYTVGTKGPRADLTASVTSGHGPLEVDFSAAGSTHPDDLALSFAWDLEGTGTFTEGPAEISHTYTQDGQYTARVRVTDSGGRVNLTSVVITVGNTAPIVEIVTPENGSFTDWGDQVAFEVKVTDPEETIDCSRVLWSYGLGHDNTHAHPLFTGTGCTATIETQSEAGHGETENIYGVIGASYTDAGTATAPALLGDAVTLLNPRELQAEHADATSGGTQIVDDTTAHGVRKVISFDAGDWLAYDPVNLIGITGVEARAIGTGTLSLHWGAPDAEPFLTIDVANTSGGWQEVSSPLVSVPEGTDRVYVTSTGGVELDQLAFTTSTDDIRDLLAALKADQRITQGVKASFGDTLAEADAALAAGDTTTAISKLQFIVDKAPTRIRTDADAAALVIRGAEAVIADIQQRLP